MLKERVYELVSSASTVGNLVAVDIDEATRVDELDVVFGVGVRALQGYSSVTREDIALDVLAETMSLDPGPVIAHSIPQLYRKRIWIPVWRYLQSLAPDHDLTAVEDLSEQAKALASVPLDAYQHGNPYKNPSYRERANAYESVAELFEKEDLSKALYLLFLRDPSTVDADELAHELRVRKDDILLKPADNRKSLWMKAVCLYDRLKYGPLVSSP